MEGRYLLDVALGENRGWIQDSASLLVLDGISNLCSTFSDVRPSDRAAFIHSESATELSRQHLSAQSNRDSRTFQASESHCTLALAHLLRLTLTTFITIIITHLLLVSSGCTP